MTELLIYDPGHSSWGLRCDLMKNDLKKLKRDGRALKHREYQVREE